MSESNLVELKYISRARQDLKLPGLSAIISTSTYLNGKNNITGVIFFDYGCFGQIIEGSRTDVENTWSKIKEDPRHYEIELVAVKDIPKRRFPKWSMKMFNTEEFKAAFPQFSASINKMSNPLDENYRSIKSLWSNF